MKRRSFLKVFAVSAVAVTGFAAFFLGRPRGPEIPLATDPDGERFVYVDGWIVTND